MSSQSDDEDRTQLSPSVASFAVNSQDSVGEVEVTPKKNALKRTCEPMSPPSVKRYKQPKVCEDCKRTFAHEQHPLDDPQNIEMHG